MLPHTRLLAISYLCHYKHILRWYYLILYFIVRQQSSSRIKQMQIWNGISIEMLGNRNDLGAMFLFRMRLFQYGRECLIFTCLLWFEWLFGRKSVDYSANCAQSKDGSPKCFNSKIKGRNMNVKRFVFLLVVSV